MTNLEQFKNDIAFNANHIQFSMADDEEMGQRGKGCYIKDIHKNGHECRNYIFDNGHHYVLDIEEQMIYVCEPILEEYFIHKFLEKNCNDNSGYSYLTSLVTRYGSDLNKEIEWAT